MSTPIVQSEDSALHITEIELEAELGYAPMRRKVGDAVQFLSQSGKLLAEVVPAAALYDTGLALVIRLG